MLASHRAVFGIPPDLCFLNAASWSPLPLAARSSETRDFLVHS
jgi:hypothetical protein